MGKRESFLVILNGASILLLKINLSDNSTKSAGPNAEPTSIMLEIADFSTFPSICTAQSIGGELNPYPSLMIGYLNYK